MLSGFDALIKSLHSKIEYYETNIAPKVEITKRHVKLEQDRALKNSTKSQNKTDDPRLNICSWKLRTLLNLGWITEEQAHASISKYKTRMLEHLDAEPTAVQGKHFSVIAPTVRKFFEEFCGVLESCSDAMADYLLETKRTQPNALIIYDDAVSLCIAILDRLQSGITIKDFHSLVSELMSYAKRIKAKMIEKRHYMTDRLAYRGIGIQSFNL